MIENISVANYELLGADIAVALVESEFTHIKKGPGLIAKIERYYPTKPILLVSVGKNGFRAFSYFQSYTILALLQLDNLEFMDLNLATAPPTPELPF